ncbi:MAG: sulfotransferase [Parvularculaceae bacterium]
MSVLRPPIFIGGCPRSGTTLLRALLDSHPSIVCGPELRAFPALASLSADMRRVMGETLAVHYRLPAERLDAVFAELIGSFLEPLREKSGKARAAEKTPANALHFAELARLFPEAHFVQIIRDGRDVVASLLAMDWKDDRTGARLAVTTDAGAAARAWADHIAGGRAAGAAGGRYRELRYERLVENAEREMRTLTAFLNEPWSDAVLAFNTVNRAGQGANESSAPRISRDIDAAAVGRWRTQLPPEARAAVKREAGALLIELGYADNDSW